MPPARRPLLPLWLVSLLASAFIVTGLAVTVLVYLTVDAALARPLNPYSPVAVAAEEVAGIALPPLEQEGAALPPPTFPPGEPTPTLIPTSTPSPDTDRINLLVIGVDRRPGEPFISRTDTMMLVSIDPQEDTVSILSIPRDLYVIIPGRGRDRINTAFVYGAGGNNPAGGASLAMQTVEYNLGVPVNHYLAVDFSAVINGINALGGIDVDVPVTINDPQFPDMNYGYDPLFIPAGRHHMDGLLALKYARTRHQDNDFNRARRQQAVVLAIRQKALSLGIAEMLRQAPFLYRQLSEGVRTDLSLEELLTLANVGSGIPDENIRTAVLDASYVTSYTTEQGASVLILLNDRAGPLIAEMFYSN